MQERYFLIKAVDYDENTGQFSGIEEVTPVDSQPISTEHDVPEIIKEYLVVNLETEDGEICVVDFSELFDLLNVVLVSPILVSQTFLKFYLSLGNLYCHLNEQFDRSRDELKSYESERGNLLNRKDDSNPLYGSMRLTKDSIESVIQSEKEWQLLNYKVKKYQSAKSQVYTAKDAVGMGLQICNAIIEKSGGVNETGVDVDREHVQNLVSNMLQKRAVIDESIS